MEPVRRERANGTKQAEDEYSEQHSLVCFSFQVGKSKLIEKGLGTTYGANVALSFSRVCITTVAKIIWAIVYAKLATPAA